MITKFWTTSLILLLSLPALMAQDQWINCLSGKHTQDAIEVESKVYVATRGGLVVMDKGNGSTRFYDRGNSDIPSNDVLSTLVDTDGLTWISTPRGVSSFDGQNWTTFEQVIGTMKKGHLGYPVVVNTTAILSWNGSDFEETLIPNPFPGLIGSVAVDTSEVNIWVSFWSFGLFEVRNYHDGQWTAYNSSNSIIPWESPNSRIVFDSNKNIWLLSFSGLFKYENGVWLNKNHLLSIPMVDIAGDIDGSVWLLTRFWDKSRPGALLRIDQNENVTTHDFPQFTEDVSPTFISSAGTAGHFYIGSVNHSCWSFMDGEWTSLQTSQTPFPNNEIEVIRDEKRVWLDFGNNFAYYKKATFNFDGAHWKDLSSFYPFNNLRNNDFEVMTDPTGNTWLLVDDTLYTEMNGQWAVADIPDIIPGVDELNSCILFDRNGKKWLLEKYTSHIFYEDSPDWVAYTYQEHGARSGNYFSFFNHPTENQVWLSSSNGVSIYDHGNEDWQFIDLTDLGLSRRNATLAYDQNGSIWGINYNEFFTLTKQSANIIVDVDSLQLGGGFRSIYVDDDGSIWLGMENAVAQFKDGGWKIFDNKNSGIQNGSINSITKDDDGNYWFGSNSGGLAIYNPSGIPETLSEGFHQTTSTSDKDDTLADEVYLFPNPAQEEVRVKLTSHHKKCDLIIFNTNGQTIKSWFGLGNDALLDLNNIDCGTYFVQILMDDTLLSKKLIIQ